jgi:hypothetical protein
LSFYKFKEIELPKDYEPEVISFTRENCLVPADTKYRMDEEEWQAILPNNLIAWGAHWAGQPMPKYD